MTAYEFDRLTRDELAEVAPGATVIVPLGSIEQHGPHLPVRVDSAIVSHLAHQAALLAGESVSTVLTPVLPFGFAHHHLPFGGTISIGAGTYLDVLTDIGHSLVRGGFSRIVFLNGHGGNDAPVRAIGDRLVSELNLPVHVAGTSYWTCAAEELAELELDVGPVPGHAGGFETSCLMALAPELVHRDRIPEPEDDLQPLARVNMPGATVRRPDVWRNSDGRTDDSRRADEVIGRRALAVVAERLAQFVVEFHRACDDILVGPVVDGVDGARNGDISLGRSRVRAVGPP